jgi:hypothetical protein
MAITNAQQYQQLVNKPSGNERPGYKGRDRDYQQRGQSKQSYSASTQQQNFSARDRDDSPPRSRIQEDRQKDFEQQQLKKRMQNLTDDQDFEEAVRSGEIDEKLYSYSVPKSNFPGPVGAGFNLLQGARQRNYEANRDFFLNKVLTSANRGNFKPTFDSYSSYMQQRLAGQIDAYGNPLGGQDDDNQPIIPLQTGIMSQAPGTTDQVADVDPNSLEGLLASRGTAYRFMADGGMTEDAIGGAADGNLDEMGRQMYGLGKLVKKATRAVKKIVKSPVGKVALAYGLTGGLSNLAGGQKFFTNFFSPSSFISKKGLGDLFSKKGLEKIGPMRLISGASLLSGLLTDEEDEDENKKLDRGPGLNIAQIRQDPYAAMGSAYGFYADGGDVKEPVAKKTMPLLDMGGMEKDYRKDGGFVPIGRMERADDVPARLSKNEFVFTADAVRNAGDGDIDKGAEVMYNMMKNLENGGDVSEESQGLKGARNMFQTSQRLEEVL